MREQDGCTVLTGRLRKPDHHVQMLSASAIAKGLGLGRPCLPPAPGVQPPASWGFQPCRYPSVTVGDMPQGLLSTGRLLISAGPFGVRSARAAHRARSRPFEASGRGCFTNVRFDGYKVEAEIGSRIRPVSFAKETSQCKITHRTGLHYTDYISSGLSRN